MKNLDRLGFVTFPGQVAGTIIIGHPKHWRWETTVDRQVTEDTLDGANSVVEGVKRINRLPMVFSLPAEEEDRELTEIAVAAMGRRVEWQ